MGILWVEAELASASASAVAMSKTKPLLLIMYPLVIVGLSRPSPWLRVPEPYRAGPQGPPGWSRPSFSVPPLPSLLSFCPASPIFWGPCPVPTHSRGLPATDDTQYGTGGNDDIWGEWGLNRCTPQLSTEKGTLMLLSAFGGLYLFGQFLVTLDHPGNANTVSLIPSPLLPPSPAIASQPHTHTHTHTHICTCTLKCKYTGTQCALTCIRFSQAPREGVWGEGRKSSRV
jgi:hypothetical protein